MTPFPIGAALMTADIARHRDWLIDGQRDLELQDFLRAEVLLGDWRALVTDARAALDGWEGRLGIHGPFAGLALDNADPEIAPIVTRRHLSALDAAEALGARQMVVHSPFTTWDDHNLGDRPGMWEAQLARAQAVLGPVVRRAETAGVTLVIENIEDRDPRHRRRLAESFASPAVKLSLDTGHAHHAHVSTGAPPVDYFARDAGGMLAHVHLQDACGHADRHWPPGRGTVPWHALFAGIAALDTRPHLLLEVRDSATVAEGFGYLAGVGLAV